MRIFQCVTAAASINLCLWALMVFDEPVAFIDSVGHTLLILGSSVAGYIFDLSQRTIDLNGAVSAQPQAAHH